MAISAPHYAALKHLAAAGELPIGGTLLEIGEANWYGDMPIEELLEDAKEIDEREQRVIKLEGSLMIALGGQSKWQSWQIAKVIYDMFFNPNDEVQSIDLNGTPDAMQLNLNKPITPNETFDTVINHGTAEHIFNVANVFKVIHDSVKVGGLMIHESPFTGWVDHGFYTLQPTLFYDVAAANGYGIRYMAIEHIETKLLQPIERREQIHELAKTGRLPNNAMLFVAMRKTSDEPFKIPMQGVYAKTVSQDVQTAWRSLR